ncbi:MAG: cyclase [Enterobacterales bacterium]|jgi:cyclase
MNTSFFKLIKTFSLSVLFIVTSNQVAAEEQKRSFSTTEVAPGLYMLMGVGGFTGGNIGLSIGEDGVVMIDDSMPPMLDIMKTAIATLTDKPVDFLINTHVHGDHIGNNAAIGKTGTWIVAHENLRTHLLENGVSTNKGNVPAPKDALPMITFSESMAFHLNGYDAHIFHVKRAHTNGDIVIFYKDPNIMHMGDVMFNGLFPYIDISKGGSVDGYIAAQQQALKLINHKTKIIPGHGPLAYKADLERSNAMIIDARNLIDNLIKAGKSEAQVVELNPLAKYHDAWNWGFITTEKMTRQVYKSLTETQ